MYQTIELLKRAKPNFITLKGLKQYLRIDHSHDDQMIEDLIEVAISTAEDYTGLSLVESSFKITIYNNLPSLIKLIHQPILRIEQFKLYRYNGEIIYIAKENYFLEGDRLKMKRYYAMEKAEITYKVGYSKEQLPAPIKQGMLEHLAKLYDLRGSNQALPLAAKSMYQAYKRVRF